MLKKSLFFAYVFLCVFILSTSPVLAQKGSLSLVPSQMDSPAVGEELELSVNITGGQTVAGYQVTVEFDASALAYVSSKNGDYLPADAFWVPARHQGSRVDLAATALGAQSQGDGTLAVVTFRVKAVKVSTVTLSEALLSNRQGQTAPPQVTGAEIAEPVDVLVPDAGLAGAIRNALGLNPGDTLTPEAIATLTSLDAERQEINDLTGLEHATNLQTLSLWGNQISDVEPLSTLTNLQMLDLSGNQVSDVAPLAGLMNLQNLELSFNQISNLQSLAGLTNLQVLKLFDNQISNLTPLAGLTKLRWLELANNQISDVSSLAFLVNLSLLRLKGNDDLEDTSPLANLPNLRDVDVEIIYPEVSIPDTALAAAIRSELGLNPEDPITQEDLLNLRSLDAEQQGITDLTGLEHAANLQTLNLHHNQISNLQPLAGLMHLNELGLTGNQISDIIPLAGLTKLQWLNLNHNEIINLKPLTPLTNLLVVGLSDNQISDVTPLAALTSITQLELTDNQIEDVTSLAALVDLWILRLLGNPLGDISPLAKLTKLTDTDIVIPNREVSIPDTGLAEAIRSELGLNAEDAITVETMLTLTSLEVSDLGIGDLTGLEYATNLQTLNLSNNQISDLTLLSRLANLQTLILIGNQISDVAPLAALVNLTTLYLAGNPSLQDTSPLTDLYNQLIEKDFEVTDDTMADDTMADVVSIPDPALVSAIRTQLGLNPGDTIIADVMLTLTSLDASGQGISDLTGLEHATNLQMLNLSDNQISDVTPLSTLTNLQELDLTNNQIINVAPLAALVSLENLHLQGNSLDDTSPLANLPNLTVDIPITPSKPEVSIPDDGLADAIRTQLGLKVDAPITQEDMLNLTTLGAQDMGISDLTGLEHATNLQTLNLDKNQISDLQPLENLANLTDLILSDNQIIDLAPLAGLTNLRQLLLNRNQIEDVTPLAGLVNLEVLWIGSNPLGDLSPLVKLVNLRQVDVRIPYPEVLVPDAGLAGAIRSELGLDAGDPITQQTMATLTNLDASDQGISDLTGLEHATNLQTLNLDKNQISDLQPLTSLTNLQSLTLTDNQIEDVTPLAALVNLETLHLAGNSPQDISALASLTNLTDVDVPIMEPRLPSDVNNDDTVDILDLVSVFDNFGETAPNPPEADINGDGVVNIADLVLVAGALGTKKANAAPILHALALDILTAAEVKVWLSQAQYLNTTDPVSQRGIRFLEQLLAALTPEKMVLLPNYPNPFNPETWIPYQLARSADVTLTIYTMNGKLVRRLDLGHQPAGVYQSRSRAAYWDGKNEVGEPVASGVCFYTITADDFTATRKMLILK